MCKALKFAGSTYYEALARVPSNKEQEYERFVAKVSNAVKKAKNVMEQSRFTANLTKKGSPATSIVYNGEYSVGGNRPDRRLVPTSPG